MATRIRFPGVKQPDGTTCYSGPNCLRHRIEQDTNTTPVVNMLLSNQAQELSQHFPTDTTRVGPNHSEDSPELAALNAWSRDVWNKLDTEETHILSWYSLSGYETINIYLRKGIAGLQEKYLRDATTRNLDEDWANKRATEEQEWIQTNLHKLDSIFEKHSTRLEHPQLLYKAFRVRAPKGTTTRSHKIEYVQQHYPVGKILENSAYTSTSIDPDYMLAFGWKNPDQIIVHEILTKTSGIPVHNAEKEYRGTIQSAEREVLLPRNTKLQVVSTKEVTFKSSYPKGYPPLWASYVLAPERKKYIVVQMVEVD